MAKRCPLDNYRPVIYTTCLECESKSACKRGELGKEEDKKTNQEKENKKDYMRM